MAIDTVDKRRSALLEGILPLADSSIGTQDRPHVVWFYRGITISQLDLAAGIVQIAFCVYQPLISFLGKVPGISFTAKNTDGDPNC